LIGVKYASIILAGSLMSYFVLVPVFAHLGALIPTLVSPGEIPIAQMTAEEIFRNYARYIGIGAIFTAGVISIIKMSPVIVKAIGIAFGEIFKKKTDAKTEGELPRVERDIPMSMVLVLLVVVTLFIWLYFRFVVLNGISGAMGLSLISIVITLIISFLFISVSAWAVAMISVTPISGMTLMTLMVTAVIFSQLGMVGQTGMVTTLLIGGVVCTALSMAGSLVTQFKLGYWLGSTPKTIQWANIGGCVISSLTVTAVIILLANVYGFKERTRTVAALETGTAVCDTCPGGICSPAQCDSIRAMAQKTGSGGICDACSSMSVQGGAKMEQCDSCIAMAARAGKVPTANLSSTGEERERRPLPAPQANAMAAVLSSIFGAGGAPWFLYGMGAFIAIIVSMLGVSPLAFALGMYLPIELNSPIMAGACVGWLIKKSTKNETLSKVRHDKGILIASGLIAGGALIGVLDALIKFFQDKYQTTLVPDFNNTGEFGNWLGITVFVLLAGFIYWDSYRAKVEKKE
jgi:uncharacterized oligopeptide transporter (OPT) family protein